MPRCGSQVTLCDIPIRFDTYVGCSHECQYCFVQRKADVFNKIKDGDSMSRLINFVEGRRTAETTWCDWKIPLHWGGMSDPFQPIERERKNSLVALKYLVEQQYPFVVSTKNKLIAEEPYLSLIKQANCVVQFSACCPEYDEMEQGASTFEERLEAAKAISPYKRVVIRCQPYIPSHFEHVLAAIDAFHEAGVHGCIFEGIKYQKHVEGTIRLQNDSVYPSDLYKKHFTQFKMKLHGLGMKFYCGENRLRSMSDELCCCGVEGMGWKLNTANLNHYLFDRKNFHYEESQKQPVTAYPFKTICQNAISRKLEQKSYAEVFDWCVKDKGIVSQLLPDGYFDKKGKK